MLQLQQSTGGRDLRLGSYWDRLGAVEEAGRDQCGRLRCLLLCPANRRLTQDIFLPILFSQQLCPRRSATALVPSADRRPPYPASLQHPFGPPAPILSPPAPPGASCPSPRSQHHLLPSPDLKAPPGIWLNPRKPKDEMILSLIIPSTATQAAPAAEEGGGKLHPGCVQTCFCRKTGWKAGNQRGARFVVGMHGGRSR